MIEILSLLCEMMSILIMLHIIMQKKIKFDVPLGLYLAVDVVVYRFIVIGVLPGMTQIIVYAAFLIYLWYRFRDEKLGKVLKSLAVTCFIMAGLQMLIMIMFPAMEFETRMITANVVIFVIVLTAYKIVKGEIVDKIRRNWILHRVIIICGIIFFSLTVLGKAGGLTYLEGLLAAVILLVVVVFYQQWKTERDMNVQREREIAMLKQYNESFDHLIKDVRARQHEFNNQINALYSMQYVCTTYEELVDKQKKYAENISRENRFNKLLTRNCSSVLKGFLYYKFSKAYENNIQIEYEINMGALKKTDVEFDMQELLGILFDNACEALAEEEEKRKVRVRLKQAGKDLELIVENPAEYMSQKEISHYVKQGNSSKGTGRGFGLSNAVRIAKKYKGALSIENKEEAGQNWVSISALLLDIL